MKRETFYPAIAILTLLLGVLGVWFLDLLPKLNNSEITELTILLNEVPAVESISDVEKLPRHRFTETFRACKPGYIQGYVTDQGQEVTEGNNCCNLGDSNASENRFNEAISNASKIFERKGERAVLDLQDETGTSVEILHYGGGTCISFIHAPSLDLALEFEKWQRSHK